MDLSENEQKQEESSDHDDSNDDVNILTEEIESWSKL
jgi:hypothetical protein